MFTRSAQVLAAFPVRVSAPLAIAVPGIIAFAAHSEAVFPLMAVAVGAMGAERVLLLRTVAQAVARTDHVTLAAPLGLR